MANWFKTIKLANKAKKERDPHGFNGVHVYKWKLSVRKKPYFVGTDFEWYNVGVG